ncbi:hypothetical protein [Burkholderia pseudomallei]
MGILTAISMAESQDFSGRAHHATYAILNEFWEDAGSGVIVLFVQFLAA